MPMYIYVTLRHVTSERPPCRGMAMSCGTRFLLSLWPQAEVLAQLRYDLPASYAFHK